MNKNLPILFIFLYLISGSLCGYGRPLVQDNLVNTTLKNKTIKAPAPHLKYNYTGTTKIPVKLRITKNIETEKDLYESEVVYFRVYSDVKYAGQTIIPAGLIVPAQVETIIDSGMNGIPSSVIFGHFRFNDIPSGKISNTVEIAGQDRSLWVFPLKWALTPLPPTGSLTNFIKGGKVNIKTTDTITIYYYPEWI